MSCMYTNITSYFPPEDVGGQISDGQHEGIVGHVVVEPGTKLRDHRVVMLVTLMKVVALERTCGGYKITIAVRRYTIPTLSVTLKTVFFR